MTRVKTLQSAVGEKIKEMGQPNNINAASSTGAGAMAQEKAPELICKYKAIFRLLKVFEFRG